MMERIEELATELSKQLRDVDLEQIHPSDEALGSLADLYVQLLRILRLPVLPVVTVGRTTSLRGEQQVAMFLALARGTEVSLLKCREPNCDKGLQLKIVKDRLRLTCETHGDWDIGPAVKV